MMLRHHSSILFVALLFISFSSFPQTSWIEGMVTGRLPDGQKEKLYGASVYWSGMTSGVTTDTSGYFRLKKEESIDQLVVRFIGYVADTISVDSENHLQIELIQDNQLDAVEVEYRQKTTTIDFLSAKKVETIGEREYSRQHVVICLRVLRQAPAWMFLLLML
ncbi:MAG: carboxypeptidase-like regulatory domain-containing protein [Cyclobacteriaceae bacterium]